MFTAEYIYIHAFECTNTLNCFLGEHKPPDGQPFRTSLQLPHAATTARRPLQASSLKTNQRVADAVPQLSENHAFLLCR